MALLDLTRVAGGQGLARSSIPDNKVVRDAFAKSYRIIDVIKLCQSMITCLSKSGLLCCPTPPGVLSEFATRLAASDAPGLRDEMREVRGDTHSTHPFLTLKGHTARTLKVSSKRCSKGSSPASGEPLRHTSSLALSLLLHFQPHAVVLHWVIWE